MLNEDIHLQNTKIVKLSSNVFRTLLQALLNQRVGDDPVFGLPLDGVLGLGQIKANNHNHNPNPNPNVDPVEITTLWSVRGRKIHTCKDQAIGSVNKVKVNERRDECKSHSLKLQVF
jgi:hypothetical protein